jgi:hypothetical protein
MKTYLLFLLFLFPIITISQNTIQFGPDGFVKIVEGSGGFEADLDPGDRFSRDHDQAGDINGDGIIDLVVGARSDDDGATDAGAVYILFMNHDGTVQGNQKISMLEGGFTDTLHEGNFFGYGVAGVGDIDSDGTPDIAVTSPVSPNQSLYIIHLYSDGTVKDFIKHENISGQGLAAITDLDHNGTIDLVACNPLSDAGGTDRGSIEILLLDHNSNISSSVQINSLVGGFDTGLSDFDQFGGRDAAFLGNIDNDETVELAVPAFMADSGRGVIWILSLDTINFHVVEKIKIGQGEGGFHDILTADPNPNGTAGANFGHALCAVGDLNGDGIADLATGANQQDEGYGYILFLNSDKTVKSHVKINNNNGGFDLILEPEERFSRSMSFVGDLRGDGSVAINFGGGAGGTGTLYLLFFKPCDFASISNNLQLTNGNILFSNWNENTQSLSGDSLSFEQCTYKVFETNAPYMIYDEFSGSCICLDSSADMISGSSIWQQFQNGCYEGSFPTATSNEVVLNSFYIYPNPVISELHIISERNSSDKTNIFLFDLTGQIVLHEEMYGHNLTISNLGNIKTGAYILQIITENNQTQKVLLFDGQ